MLFFRNFLVVTLFLSLIYCSYRTYLQIRVVSLVAGENEQHLELPQHDVQTDRDNYSEEKAREGEANTLERNDFN